MASEKLNNIPLAFGDAIDVSHHLSQLSRNRVGSPLKGLQKYFGKPGMLSLAGGLPHPSYFPFETVKGDGLVFDSFSASASPSQAKGNLSWLWNLFSSSKPSTMPITVPKFPENPDDVSLSVALQYGLAKGLPQLQKFIQDFTANTYKPAYANYTTLLHAGNTDAWNKAVMTLCNPGEGILTSEWTYPSAIASMRPHGINPVPVGMDGQGMSSVALREVLSGWKPQARGGMPRPHVMYIVPVGQNPTGATMGLQRKKEIYEICVEYDVIIVEDDPYYFLQEGNYVLPSRRAPIANKSVPSDEEYVKGLTPSFLACDYQGRVIRLDTFSKTIAPGSRLGWFTCNPIFAERFERQAETSTQAPCGFGQSLITELLIKWQYHGYLRWLKGLGVQYTQRRDFFLDCLVEKFHVELAPPSESTRFKGSDVYLVSEKTPSGWFNEKAVKKPMFSFVPPTSGMFVWLQLNFEGHPKIAELGHQTLEMKLWEALAEGGLLVGPGTMFSASQTEATDSLPGHFRVSFSYAEYDDLKKSIDIFASVLKEFYKN